MKERIGTVSPVGISVLIDLLPVEEKDLTEIEFMMSNFIKRVAVIIKDKIAYKKLHKFRDSGITGIAILSNSHIAIASYPEYDYISIDVFRSVALDTITTDMIKKEAEEIFKSKINWETQMIRGGIFHKDFFGD